MARCTVSGEEPTNPDNAPVPNDTKRPDGQAVDHWVMCPTEVMKAGFNRPVRLSYRHVGKPFPRWPTRDLTDDEKQRFNSEGQEPFVKFEHTPRGRGKFWTQAELDAVNKGCGTITSMPRPIAETYAAEPGYYGSTFCCGCGKYLPVGQDGEFVWEGTDERVGT